MKIVSVETASASYPVYIGAGLLANSALWQRHLGKGATLVVSNDVVAPLYMERTLQAMNGQRPDHLIIADGEVNKDAGHWQTILDHLVNLGAGRDTTVVALGGGVIGDLAGFAAACYMRGVNLIHVPTTLLAQVDAAVGGKTAINHPRGKNLIGTFHQPRAVLADTDTLNTLPDREFRAGLAEVVKYGAIRDLEFLEWLERNVSAVCARLPDALNHIIQISVAHKAEIVAADEREAGERALLNFGHTFGHGIEAVSGYRRYHHGEAVAIGMVLAAAYSECLDDAGPGTAARLARLLQRLGLDTDLPEDLPPEALLDSMRLDKKNRAGQLRLVLLRQLGDAVVSGDIDADRVLQFLHQAQSGALPTADYR